ncbi:hypothetical protein J4E80_000037 [Alternaria sp. BMP 0032]|nr:hypothetical protein J4E80_000037 [Alternaria sp. BMP 0032]
MLDLTTCHRTCNLDDSDLNLYTISPPKVYSETTVLYRQTTLVYIQLLDMAAGPLHLQQPGPIPLYVLLVLVVGICCYFFFIGTAAVRLWFYKGALGPAPERFIVIRNETQEDGHNTAPIHSKHNEHGTSAETLRKRRMTVFTHDSLSAPTETIAHSTAFSPRNLSTATTTVNLQDISDISDLSSFTNPQTRAYLAEERRISRMPAFDADDCGTGDYFPDIPVTNRPIESTTTHSNTLTASHLGLTPTPRSNWLTISPQYIEYHAARTHLLLRNRSSCIHVTPEGERACRELLQEVTSFLVDMYPHQFRFLTKTRRKHVLNELTREDFEIEHGLECHPLEVCARLCAEDFMVWGRSESTLNWYLQAATTLFPSGYVVSPYMGKTVDVVVGGEGMGKPPMIPWSGELQFSLLSQAVAQPKLTHISQTSNPSSN